MKFATYQSARGPAVSLVDTERGAMLDLAIASGGDARFASMLAVIDGGADALDAARALQSQWSSSASLPLATARLLAPLPEPRQIRDGMFFEEHLINAGRRSAERLGTPAPKIPAIWYERPIYYLTSRYCVAGPDHEVVWPRNSTLMDFECEYACVIGKTGRDISAADAMAHVFGFTVFNDFSARDIQAAEMQGRLGPSKGKNFDGSNVFGPWIVTTDEIGDPHALKMEARVNGARWGGGHSSAMHHKWPDVIAFISANETLHAGEIIGSGTVGTGCGLEQGRFLADGDVVELEVEKIGVLRNRVVVGSR
jgi:2-keto-4-pentenoate hydratase/2-oxohepta-3-ene-1,7-dioic acid hydratase in catechol pathway